MYDISPFRTRAEAANSYRRAALDDRLATRLESRGVRAYRSEAREVLVDLATEGAMVQPRGRPLINCSLFGSQFIRVVMSLRRELTAYEQEHGRSENIVSIRIRPSRDRDTEMGRLLDAQGNAPLLNLRRVHRVAGGVIQGAFEYMESKGWLVQLAIGRHWDPVEGGVAFDWHAHVTAEVVPECSALVTAYLHKKFDRVWISSEEEPGIQRDLVATACYPAAKIANRGWEDVADEHLVEFFKQSAGLRRIEVAGPIRAARQEKRRTQPSEVSGDRGPAAELAAIAAEAAEMLPDALSANEMLQADADGDVGSATPTGDASEEKAPRAPRLLRCHFAYFDLTLRWVARVSDYAGWYDLLTRCDLSLDIADAKALAARAAHLLSLNPAIPESQTDESLEFESLVEWGPLAAGNGRPTAEPQRDRGPQEPASGDKAAGSQAADNDAGDAGGAPASDGHPTTPEKPATLPQNNHLAEPITPTRLDVDGTEVFTLELVVRSEGPAIVTAKVSMPTRFLSSVGHTVTTLPPPP